MSSFLEQYGKAIFVLVLMAILIAFAGPLGMKIKNATTDKVSQTEQIGCDEFTVATGGTVRPTEPAEAVDQVYCIYYDDGEMTISQNKIEPEAGRTVVKKGFYSKPRDCTAQMTTVRFIGAVKPKSVQAWFRNNSPTGCTLLTEIKNIENLYTTDCTDMSSMFANCQNLTNLDVSGFNTENVTNMQEMFDYCKSLTSIEFGNNFDTSKVTNMAYMFSGCSSLISLNLSNFDTSACLNMYRMFNYCLSLITIKWNNWNTSNVTNMEEMFRDCKSLQSLNFNGFNVDKVSNMRYMFERCYSLTSLNMRELNINNKTNIFGIFDSCNKLKPKSIKISQITFNTIIDLNIPNSNFRQYFGVNKDVLDIVK